MKKKILFASSEAVPFIKTGGLADVAGTLPKYFDKEKYEVRLILPKYLCMSDEWKDKLTYITDFTLDLGWRRQYAGVFEAEADGLKVYFIDNEFYFQGSRPYNEIYMDIEKYAFFSKAVLAALPLIGFRPDIIHCNDWQTSLIPVYLKEMFCENIFYGKTRTLISIHNLKFQGNWGIGNVQDATGLPERCFTSGRMEFGGSANLLKGGIVYADYIATVSKTYADEIQTDFYGEGLNTLLRRRSGVLSGILNGIDYQIYDPENDPLIEEHFNIKTSIEGKKKNKLALQKQLGLAQDPDAMLIGIVSRLTDQKGFDLIDCVMGEMISDPIQFVILGTGEEKYENMFRHYAWRFPEKVSASITYNEKLSHRIYASCDAFLMPSLFEPCGLSQMMSMRYGTIPIVRETGGLKDTVEAYNEYDKSGTGFSFCNYNAHEMMATVRYAETVFRNKESWHHLVESAMKKDFSWDHAAREYEELYEEILTD